MNSFDTAHVAAGSAGQDTPYAAAGSAGQDTPYAAAGSAAKDIAHVAAGSAAQAGSATQDTAHVASEIRIEVTSQLDTQLRTQKAACGFGGCSMTSDAENADSYLRSCGDTCVTSEVTSEVASEVFHQRSRNF